MSAQLIKTEDCIKIIDFMEDNLDKFTKSEPRPGYNTNTLNLVVTPAKYSEIDSLLFNIVGSAVRTFISEKAMRFPGSLCKDIKDSGYELRKVIGETVLHQDGLELIVKDSDVTYRVATLVISFKDTGDKLMFPELDITVPLREGTIVFFPPYWTHRHCTEWSGIDGYRAQTWLTNTIK